MDSRAYFDAVLAEYNQHRTELLQAMTMSRTLTSWYLVLLAAAITALGYIIQNDKHTELHDLILLFPLGFQTLLFFFLRYMLLHIEIVEHLQKITLPQIRAVLNKIDDKPIDAYQIFFWYDKEGAGYSSPLERYPKWIALITSIPSLAPTACSLLFILIFFYLKSPSISFWQLTRVERAILLLDIFVVVYGLAASLAIGGRRVTTLKTKAVR